MKKAEEYIGNIKELFEKVLETQMDNIDDAAKCMAESLKGGKWIYIFGTGHSHMLAEELFYRAGGLVRIKPILEDGLMLHQSAAKSTELERISGYADILLDEYGVTVGDTMIIISNSGRNSVCVEMALGASRRGMHTIALTSRNHSTQSESRHKSRKRLFECVDVVLDNCGIYGDASISFGERMAAPTSTVIGAMMLNAMVCAVIEILTEEGIDVELYSSSNISGGSEVNNQFIQKYKGQIKSL